jgi:ABC-type nitrate/sulfonate/bicarbonate transport system substrate-binding protein
LDSIKINYLPLRELDPVFDYYTPVLISSEQLIKDSPDLIQRFVRATAKGYLYCISQPKKPQNSLASRFLISIPNL